MTDTHTIQRTRRGLDLATAADLADLFHELSQNKDTRKIVAQAVKKLKPDSPHAMAFADIDQDDKFEAFRKEQADAELKRQHDLILERMNAKRTALLTGGPDGAGRKYGEDDVKKIEELMQRKGITDYDDGATLYAATLPPVDPRPGEEIPVAHGTTWEFPRWSDFGADPVAASRKEATAAITELMRKR